MPLNDKKFGHDGRGNYFGESLVDVDPAIGSNNTQIMFDELLTSDSILDPNKLKGSAPYGTGFTGLVDRQSALDYLQITSDMLQPGIPGPQGATGPEGPQGKEGPAGPAGAIGPQGPTGKDGAAGAQGGVGPQGPAGPQGPIGKDGKQGVPGADGKDGAQGPIGPIGPAGLIWKSLYDNAVNYDKDDAVGFEGASYFCLRPSIGIPPLPENDSWALLAAHGLRGEIGPEGPAGKDGVSDIPGPEGPQGPAGGVGPQGPAGPQGPIGKDGAIGPAGPSGKDGPAGAQGPQGPAGGIGPQGPQGPGGPQGVQGPPGLPGKDGVIDIDALSQAQLKALYDKLAPFHPQRFWVAPTVKFTYPLDLKTVYKVQLWDLNINLHIKPYSYEGLHIEASNAGRTDRYDIRWFTNYGNAIDAWTWVDKLWPESPVLFDDLLFGAARQFNRMEIFDRTRRKYYTLNMFIVGGPIVSGNTPMEVLMTMEDHTAVTLI